MFLYELGYFVGLCYFFVCNNGCLDINEVVECNNFSVGCVFFCGNDINDGCSFGSNNIMFFFLVVKVILFC